MDISVAGSKVTIIAVPTFPQGFTIEEWATDADPLTIEDVQIAQSEVGVNGDVVSWHRAVMVNIDINVIPNSEADKNLMILTATNKIEKNKVSLHDNITMVIAYPDGTIKTFSEGTIVSGSVANSMTNDGKIRSKNYKFTFGKVI